MAAKATLTDSLKDSISMTQAAALLPGRPHVGTVWRYATQGVRGVKLASWMSGGKRVTTAKAVEEFLQALNANAGNDGTASEDFAKRSKSETSAALAALG